MKSRFFMFMVSCCLLFLASLLFTGLFRRWAIATHLLDIPNERSSHQVATPRGGGLVFVVLFLLLLLASRYLGFVDDSLFFPFFTAGTIIATTGFVDDRVQLSAKWRLLAQIVAGLLIIHEGSGFPPLPVFSWYIPAGLVLNVLGFFYFIWMINLYNFMDGINGLAALEAISVCLGGALLWWLHGNDSAMLLPLGLAAVCGGFLYWNFPRARIFMGDAGSGFLGLSLAVLSLQAGKYEPGLFWAWLILSGVFIVDATVTLIRRGLRGERVFSAHSQHAYQHAARTFGRHAPVTLAVVLINLAWLLPWAVLVATQRLQGVTGLLIAYTPLIVLACLFQAGRR
ncbi:MraY family glycosyltransferase [Legionella sp. CNM-4043-24]|uniref:MraY family glycosyltransferase n=1 Tax=Legionella sp. CNM-4043-24 TaxID=3421646 RepID=UPI00403A9645